MNGLYHRINIKRTGSIYIVTNRKKGVYDFSTQGTLLSYKNYMKKYKVAIVGATGAVGREMLNCLITHDFPYESIKLLASSRSAGKLIKCNNEYFVVEELTYDSFIDIDIAFFSAGGNISKEYAYDAKESGAIVIDNTSYFRMHDDIPLVVPEVNSEELLHHNGIIANPNCSTIQMVSALKQIHDHLDIEKIIVSTYQAVSGAGNKAMTELTQQSFAILNNQEPECHVLPCAQDKKHYPIAFNVLPQIDTFDQETHFSKEELKMINETKKILGKSIKVNATCVRVPVYRGHSESVYVEVKKDFLIEDIFTLVGNSKGITLVDNVYQQLYPTPLEFEGSETVAVGRIRKDLETKNGLSMWIVSDNLLKGAAYNAIEIAFKLIELNLI